MGINLNITIGTLYKIKFKTAINLNDLKAKLRSNNYKEGLGILIRFKSRSCHPKQLLIVVHTSSSLVGVYFLFSNVNH